MAKCSRNRRNQEQVWRKDCSSFGFLGAGIWVTASTLSGLTAIPLRLIRCPSYLTSVHSNAHLARIIRNWNLRICARTEPRSSRCLLRFGENTMRSDQYLQNRTLRGAGIGLTAITQRQTLVRVILVARSNPFDCRFFFWIFANHISPFSLCFFSSC
jgi:hypothetical protein